MSLVTKGHLSSLIELFKNLLSFKADKTELNVLSDNIEEVKEGLNILSSDLDSYTPDWNADKGDAGHIENRTHYEYIIDEKALFENKKIDVEFYRGNFSDTDGFYFKYSQNDLIQDAKYRIKYQIGVSTIELKAEIDPDNGSLGGEFVFKAENGQNSNGYAYLYYNGNGFYGFGEFGAYGDIMREGGDPYSITSATISLYREPVKAIKTLDKKFLPSDLQGDLTELINTVTETKMNKENPIGSGSFSFNTSNSVGSYGFNTAYNGTVGNNSFTEGYGTKATGTYSHAEGYYTEATGYNSHAEGWTTKAYSQYQHVEGKYNVPDSSNAYSHIVGNGTGTSTSNQSNSHTLDWAGNAWFSGDVYVGSTSGKNKDTGSQKLATENLVEESVEESKDECITYVNQQVEESKDECVTYVNQHVEEAKDECVTYVNQHVKEQIDIALSSLARIEEVTW